jgi:energy-coupling factor transporter ATP-binding protein EcfA2
VRAVGALYGRAEQVARVAGRVRDSCAGTGALVLLTGEPGIGKSRLAEHLAGLAAAEGARLFWGRCWEAGGAPAYWPWIQIFRALEMDDDPFAVAPDVGGTAEQGRFQLFDLAVRRLKERASRAPIALVLDDLHAADIASLLLLLMLARDLRRSRILVIATSRDADARLMPEAAALLAKIGREGEVLALGRLEPKDLEAWVAEALPSATRQQTELLYQVTEGHPLFITEMLGLGPPDRARDRLLDNLGATLDERTLSLPEQTRAILEVAAVVGREFSVSEVAAVAEQPDDEVERRLREARTAGVVSAGAASGSYLFSHVLRRDRIYAELLASRRAALHWAIGTERLARGEDPSAAVHHLIEGEPAGDGARAAEVALVVAEAALARHAFEEASDLARRAWQLLPSELASSRLSCQLRLVLAEALVRVGQGAEGKQTAMQAAALARELGGADDLLARAALVYGVEQVVGAVDGQMVDLLREALATLPPTDSSVRARLTARLAAALMPPRGREDYLHNVGLARDAVAMARRLDDRHTLLYTLQNSLNAFGFVMANDDRTALLEEIIDLAGTLGQRLVLTNSLGPHAAMLAGRGRHLEAEMALQRLERLLAELPDSQHQWRAPLARAMLAGLNADFAEADRLGERARQLAHRQGANNGVLAWAHQRLSLALLRDQPRELLGQAEALALQGPLAGFPNKLALALFLAAIGQRDQATRMLRAAAFDPGDVASVVFGAQTCVLLGDAETARRLGPPLAEVAPLHRLFWGPATVSVFGPVSRLAGEVALLAGRPAEAIRHHDDALAVCAVVGSPVLLALCTRARDEALARAATPAPRPPAAVPARLELRREGELWALLHDGGPPIRLKHSKGLGYLQYLLAQPGRETHVLELVGSEHAAGDAGPVLDARAKAEYRQRLDDLKDELEEGERFGDRGRVARAQEQIESIAEQLAGAVGLGGRDRRAASDAERARVNVQRCLKDAVDRIAAADPDVARYLSAALKTGIYCSFNPV